MGQFRKWRGPLAAACGWLISGSLHADTPAQDLDDLQALVTDAVRPIVVEHRVPGMAIGLIVDGEHYFFNFGVASEDARTPVTEHTLFEIGSVSKTFTATLAAYAQEKGVLAMEQPVTEYLTALQGSAFDDVSVLNLATHTAGHFPLQVPEKVNSDKQLFDYFRQWQPQYRPGSKRTYANPGSGLLGVVSADSLGQPFSEVMEQTLFRGLGLSETYLRVPTERMSDYAEGHNSKHQAVRLNNGLLGNEAYGVKSTSADLIRYLATQMQLVKTPETFERALQATRRGYFKTDYYVQDMVWEQYALPVEKKRLLAGNSRSMIIGDHPVTAIDPPLDPQQDVLINKTGSTGGFSTYVAFIPGEQFGFVLLANKYFPNEPRIEALYHMLETLLPRTARETAVTAD
ncbi:class C beta-lactamase [Microbulbifer sp.]|uniref:class C beta-lactamase n=1 Tax=Microbulbifer sp. TaxID=1908541 RepID=UPI002583F3CF|nr:class C beta-lactamase [Microbulbifer sp.]